MLVIFDVFISTSFSICKSNLLLINASKDAPIAPNEDASVGVATPNIIDPKTINIKNKGEYSEYIISFKLNTFSNF